jgi:hypothetical protein
MFQDWPPMGDHQQELGADSSEYVDHSSIQSAKQQKRKKQNRPGQLDSNMTEVCTHAPETGLAGLPFHTSLGIQPRPYGPSEQTHSLTAQHTKRPFVGGTSESSTKRCRISSSVNVPKPSLMVKFKLTPAKGVPNRGKTAPPQQSATSMPSPELPSLDEIIDRRSMAPVDRRSNMASTESWTQPADHQPIAKQHMQASVESVAESDEDTTPVPNGSPPTQIAPIDLTKYARSHWTHDLTSGQTLTQNAPLSSRQPRLSYPGVIESPSGPAVENTDLSGRRSLRPDRSRRTALDYGPIGLHEAATNTLMTMIDHTEALPATTAGPPAGFVKELHITPTNARQIISELHSTTEPEAATDLTKDAQPEGVAETRDILEPQTMIDSRDLTQSSTVPEPLNSLKSRIPEHIAPQETNTTQPLVVDASETVSRPIAASDSSSHPNDALDIELELYIDGKANMNLAEPDAWLMLTDMTNRDELFRLAKDLLEALSHLDAGDEIVAIIFKRPDGEAIPGTSKTSIPITRVGQQDMWKRLVKNMSGAGTWKGELRGYVRVQKAVHGE